MVKASLKDHGLEVKPKLKLMQQMECGIDIKYKDLHGEFSVLFFQCKP
jgi:hypothetical protein